MGYFDCSREPKSDIAFADMRSFYASVECVERGLYLLRTSLCVMSRADNSNGLILASSTRGEVTNSASFYIFFVIIEYFI